MWGAQMIELKILTQRYQKNVEEKINKLIETKQIDEKSFEKLEENDRVSFNFAIKKQEKDRITQLVSTMISDLVQEEILKQFSKAYLKKKKELKNEDKKAIQEYFILNNYMSKEEGVSYISYYVIYTPLVREIEKHQQLHIDGWITFRMKKYQMILQDILEQTIDDYKTQQEYLNYISMLIESRRHFKGGEKTMHLIPINQGQISILNHFEKDVTSEYIKRYCKEVIEDAGTTPEDLLMHVFITVPPENLIIHHKEIYANKRFVHTIELIFAGHIRYCTGCELCSQVKEE